MTNKANRQVFDNYEILAPLGKGRFAEVFRAIKRDIGREVALKILLPVWNENAAVREQFMTQARLIARLRHPRIVDVLDLGEDEGRLYMAMEYLPGGDLHLWLERLEGKRPSLPQIATLIEDVAAALDFIHHQSGPNGLLAHGDVKPANILLAEDRESTGLLRARLSDLGLLNALQQAAARTGTTIYPQSSPLYISPEQANDQPPTPLSDQYSLAVVAYEMLTGRPPFQGGSDPTLYRQHRQETPSLPSSLNPDLPPEMDEVLLKALAKDPTQRYLDCPAFARALRQAVELAGQKLLARLLEEARAALQAGHPEGALAALEKASRLKTDDPEVKRLQEQAHKHLLAQRNYQEAAELLESARREAQTLRLEAPALPDPQKLLATFVPLPPSPLQKLWTRWKVSLLLAAALLILALFANLNYAATTSTRDPAFQTRIAPLWTASPTFTPTFTPTLTFTPTFTPTPPIISIRNASNIRKLHQFIQMNKAGYIMSLAFSPDSSMLAVDSDDGSIFVFSIKTKNTIKILRNVAGVRDISFSPDGTWLAAGSDDDRVRIWQVKDWKMIHEYNDDGHDVNSIAFSRDGKFFGSATSYGQIFIRETKNWTIVHDFLTNYPVNDIAFSSDNKYLAITNQNYVNIFSLQDFDLVTDALTDGSDVLDISFSNNGSFLAGGAWDGDVRFWDIQNSWFNYYTPGCGNSITSISFSANSEILAAAGGYGICIYHARDKKEITVLKGHNNGPTAVAFSPDGWWLASASWNEVFLWGVPRWDALTATSTP